MPAPVGIAVPPSKRCGVRKLRGIKDQVHVDIHMRNENRKTEQSKFDGADEGLSARYTQIE
jgi:hypothetical protein